MRRIPMFFSGLFFCLTTLYGQNLPTAAISYSSVGADKPITVTADCAVIEDPAINENSCKGLTCAQDAIQPKPIPHNNTKKAVDNLLKCLKSSTQGSAVIVGHGLVGRIDTGGEPRPGTNQFISFQNASEQIWGPTLDRLKNNKLALLTLLGCFTGYSDSDSSGPGITLLSHVAAHTKSAKVRAPTGEVFCRDKTLYLVGDADWQYSSMSLASQPSMPATPTNQFIMIRNSDPQDKHFQKIDRDQLIDLRPAGDHKKFDKVGPPLSEDVKQKVLNAVDFETIFEHDGCPIAGTVAYLQIKFKKSQEPKAKEETRILEVLSDGLVRDTTQENPNVFYRGTLDLVTIVQNMQAPESLQKKPKK